MRAGHEEELAREVEGLHAEGRYRDAYRRLEARTELHPRLSPLRARSARHVGRDAEAVRLGWRLGAAFPDSARAWRLGLRARLERGALLEVLEALQADAGPAPRDDEERLAALCFRSWLHGTLRDFERAEELVEEALALAPQHADPLYVRALLRYLTDRMDEALAEAEAARARHPLEPELERLRCQLLHEASRRDEALAAYEAADARQQCLVVAVGRASCLVENGLVAEGRAASEALLERFPEMSARARRGLRRRLVDLCRRLGDDAGALAHARATNDRGLVERLEAQLASGAPPGSGRVALDVPFVRQEHLGCVPATISALLGAFGREADARSIAAEITYDGTPAHRELAWARANGLELRRFRLDAATGRALLERGLAFSLDTRAPDNAHRQGVVGRDDVLGTWLVREPGWHHLVELEDRELEPALAARGGSAVLLVPPELAERAPAPDELPLEAELRAEVLLEEAWHHHRMDELRAHHAVLAALPPSPPRWDAERVLGAALGDVPRRLAATREQHAHHPRDPWCAVALARALDEAGRVEERRRFLEAQLHGPARCGSMFVELAAELAPHAGEEARVRRLLRRAVQLGAPPARALRILSGLDERAPERRERAIEWSRLAAVHEAREEWYSAAHHGLCLRLGRPAEGLAFLERRCEDLGARSPRPFATLATALREVHRRNEALEVLRRGLERHEDAELRGLLADGLTDAGRFEEAAALLDASGGLMPPARLAGSRAWLARARGELERARAEVEAGLAQRPGDRWLHRTRLELALGAEGRAALVEAVRALVAEQGDDPELGLVAIGALREVDAREEAVAALRALLERAPGHPGLRFELADVLLEVGAADEARALAEELAREQPHSSPTLALAGKARLVAGERDAARAAFRASIEGERVQPLALRELAQLAATREQAAEELRRGARALLERYGEPGFHELHRLGFALWEPEERREWLARLAAEYPAEPAPRLAAVGDRLAARELDEARALAEALRRELPWHEPAIALHADVLRACEGPEAERRALADATRDQPQLVDPWLRLGESLQAAGRVEEARAVLLEAAARHPDVAGTHGYLADLFLTAGEHEAALAALARACELHPEYAWAWQQRLRLLLWLEREDEALELARERARRWPRDAAAHAQLADVLVESGGHEEAVPTLRRALELDPLLGPSRERLIELLGRLGRMEEARAVLEEGLEAQGPTPALRFRRAWLRRLEGDHDGAREELRAQLAELPEETWMWARWLDWCDEDGCGEEIVALYDAPPGEAAEALAALGLYHGYAGDALAQAGRAADAEAALRRALEREDDYDWARFRLGALLRERGELEAERALYERYHPAALSPPQALAVLQNAALREDLRSAEATLRALLADQELDVDTLRRARAALPAGRARALASQLAAAPDAGEQVLVHALWLDALEGDWRGLVAGLERLWPARLSPERLADVLMATGDDARLRRAAADWIARRFEPGVECPELWGALGYVCNSAGRHEDTLRLCLGDHERSDLRAWMLANPGDALRALERVDELERVSRHALTLPRDHSVWWHRVNLAYVALCRGELDEAERLARVPVVAHHGPRLDALALRLALRARRDGRRAGREELRAALGELLAIAAQNQDPDAELFAARLLRREVGGWRAALFALGPRGRRLLRAVSR